MLISQLLKNILEPEEKKYNNQKYRKKHGGSLTPMLFSFYNNCRRANSYAFEEKFVLVSGK